MYVLILFIPLLESVWAIYTWANNLLKQINFQNYTLIWIWRGRTRHEEIFQIFLFELRNEEVLLTPNTILEKGESNTPLIPFSYTFPCIRSGLGEETCLPPAIHFIPPTPTMESARGEAELVIFSLMDSLFDKTGTKPKDIDILIVNCSLFSPTPSLSAMVVNKYKMRSNIRTFNLSGMGCSAGVISIDLAHDLLQFQPNLNALVVSTEIITPNYYQGKERSMLLPNCLFRMGGAAILLSNRRSDRWRAKYRLLHVVRTHKGKYVLWNSSQDMRSLSFIEYAIQSSRTWLLNYSNSTNNNVTFLVS